MYPECIICNEPLINNTEDTVCTPCYHTFHAKCITQWLERSPTCPQCRAIATVSEIHKLHFDFPETNIFSQDVHATNQVQVENNKSDQLSLSIEFKDSSEKAKLVLTLKDFENQTAKLVKTFKNEVDILDQKIQKNKNFTEEYTRIRRQLRSLKVELVNMQNEIRKKKK